MVVPALAAKDKVTCPCGDATREEEASEGHVFQRDHSSLCSVGSRKEIDCLHAKIAALGVGCLNNSCRVLLGLLSQAKELLVNFLVDLVRKLPGQKLIDVSNASPTDNALHADAGFCAVLDLQVLAHLELKIIATILPRRKLGVAAFGRPNLIITVGASREVGLAQASASSQDSDRCSLKNRRLLQHLAFPLDVESQDAVALRLEIVDEDNAPDAKFPCHGVAIKFPPGIHEVRRVIHDHARDAQARYERNRLHLRGFQEDLDDLGEGIELLIGVLHLIDGLRDFLPGRVSDWLFSKLVLPLRVEEVKPRACTAYIGTKQEHLRVKRLREGENA
mmetsp:Transcript_11271/g.25275  ORF Transcript_11271/g.25275 Transcript_11271/m.25275 type:complete len:334 (-) Transcript_11271:105-1106(-)